MADVFGTIGNEQVELNNAATEATLKLLLQSSLASNKQSIESINKIAVRAGVDENTVKQTNQRINAFGQAAFNTGAAWAGLSTASDTLRSAFINARQVTEVFTSGATQASDVLALVSRIGGPLGLVISGMSALASFQENLLKSYQGLTQAGVNFGGSLTDLRLAASNTYMTMDQFTNLIKQNSENFAKMGGTANEGAIAFTKVASALQKSEFGDQLRALGYTSEQANQGLATYIAMTGGRNRQEMQDTRALSAAAAEYMSQLDALAQITGKSKEAQEQALKEAAANQAYQSYLLTLDEEGRKKANAAMMEAQAKGGKGAAEALMSQLLGLPPMTKAAQEFTAVAPKMAAANNQMASAVKDSSKGLSDVKKAGDALGVAANETKKDLGATGQALIMQGGTLAGTISQVTATANRQEQQGIKTQADAEAQRKKIEGEQTKREASQAAAAAETQKKLNELGQAIMEKMMPAVAGLLSVFNPLIQSITDFVTWIAKTPVALSTMLTIVGGLGAAFLAYKASMAVKAAKAVTRGTLGNPMIVQEAGGGTAAGGKGKTSPGAKASKMGGLAKGLMGGVGGVLGGLALGVASEKLKESGYEKLGAGADIGSAALTGAGMGAMLGPVGAAVGGALGGAYGLYQNWGALFGGSGKEVPKPSAAEAAASAATGMPPAETVGAVAEETPIEKLVKQMERLNIQTADVVRYMRETAEQTRRTVDATKQLSGNLFPTP